MELDLIPVSAAKRVANRTIANRLIAMRRDAAFFDGDRQNGYGGYVYDGRQAETARRFCEHYSLDNASSVMQVQCEKGFLLYEFLQLNPLMRVRGTENSIYALSEAIRRVGSMRFAQPTENPFKDKEFDLVIALGVVYALTLTDAVKCLQETERVGRHGYVTLAAYETLADLELFRRWTLLGTTILKRDEWLEVMRHAGYRGDYSFVTAHTLGLCES